MSITSPTTSTEVCERGKYLLNSNFNNSGAHFCMPQYFFSNMPGLLNSLRSRSFPNLFRKFLCARNSPPRERPQLSRGETDSFIDCIASPRRLILELERHVESLQDDTLVVCRSIQYEKPDITPPVATRLPEIFQGAVVLSPAEASPKLANKNSPPSNDKLDIPATLSKYAPDVPEAQRKVPSPTCISFEDMAFVAGSESDLQVQFDLLALKKAKLEVEVMKLEVNVLLSGGLHKQSRSVNRQEEKEEAKEKSHSSTWRPSKPSLLGQWSFNAGSLPSDTGDRSSDTSQKFTSPRKGVPI